MDLIFISNCIPSPLQGVQGVVYGYSVVHVGNSTPSFTVALTQFIPI